MKANQNEYKSGLQQVNNIWMNISSLGKRYVLKSSVLSGEWQLQCLSLDDLVSLYSLRLSHEQANEKVDQLLGLLILRGYTWVWVTCPGAITLGCFLPP